MGQVGSHSIHSFRLPGRGLYMPLRLYLSLCVQESERVPGDNVVLMLRPMSASWLVLSGRGAHRLTTVSTLKIVKLGAQSTLLYSELFLPRRTN